MGQYIPFTEEQKLRAGEVDLEDFLLRRGEKLLVSGREKRLASDHSITVRGNEWYDHAAERGGGPVSFVQNYYGLSYPEAVSLLLGSEAGQIYPPAQERKEQPPKASVTWRTNFFCLGILYHCNTVISPNAIHWENVR